MSDFVLANLREITTTPPQYMVSVNGKDIIFSKREFNSFRLFATRVEDFLDIVPPEFTETAWENACNRLKADKIVIKSPNEVEPSPALSPKKLTTITVSITLEQHLLYVTAAKRSALDRINKGIRLRGGDLSNWVREVLDKEVKEINQ